MAHGHALDSIASRFGISKGSASLFFDRSLRAITRQQDQHLSWPTVARRQQIKDFVREQFGIPHCIGFIDGTHINLARAPARPEKGAAAFHSRKERYGMLLLAAVDERKRFTFIHYGYSARSSDMRAQQASRLHTDSHNFFNEDEYLLADSGFLCTTNIIPMYRKNVGEEDVTGHRRYFNKKGAKAQVCNEHAFGTDRDDQRVILMIIAACILHNLCISTWQDHITQEELQEVMGDEYAERKRQIDLAGDKDLDEQYRRRERLWKDMLSIDPHPPKGYKRWIRGVSPLHLTV
ncbi:hypothetical protein CI109_105753 [Kwoniella shandongensis]|uniref:Uncharacterized protein n=1 Tax=Kwoniella shandongensis TaxID=1734106 RepID=A0A5M6C1I3_9TREE|nr:uncharacterized protein CI109_003093 [Kwoniella shandongensis]KAA5528561.1 hypothetical protein CI109_003093 [Kwoniella shandongensis]